MKKRVIVISLGGSQIIHDNKINVNFLLEFKKIILKYKEKYRFVVVCGGGSVARMYIKGLQKINRSEKFQNFAGISITRANARFMSYFFGIDSERGIPHKMREIKRMIRKKDFVFCGALEYHPEQTSDTTSAQVARRFNADFINLTNVDGFYRKNPMVYKNAKLVPRISWREFYKFASKLGFKPGQHFVLDKKAARVIMENKIRTFILGQDLKNFEKVLKNEKFMGTLIFG